MQINRMFEIIYILINKKTVTAKEFAERFCVSVRTIYRDIETLSQLGIPVYMSKGKGGGISILDNFVLNKSVLSDAQQTEILTALSALKSVSKNESENAIEKLSAVFGKSTQNWIKVNFSRWHGFDTKFETIKEAILSKKVLSFDYNSRGQEKTNRITEPLQLQFNNNAWYMYAFCRTRDDKRIFKISRMENLKITENYFDRCYIEDEEKLENEEKNLFSNPTKIVLKIDKSQAFRVYDDFTDNEVSKCEDGDFLVTLNYPEDEWVYGYILSFGCFAEVLEPVNVREIVISRIKKSFEKYSGV